MMNHLTWKQLCTSLMIFALTIGCADTETDLLTHSAEKSYWSDDEGYEGWDDTDLDQEDGLTPNLWGEAESDQQTQYDDSAVVTHHTTSPTLGGVCAPGCIWSSYAVNMGAQSAEATCDGASCACVAEGDIWSSCSASNDPSTTPPETNQRSTPQTNGYNATIGNRLADEAYYIASRRNTTGYCYSAAADAIEAVVGRFLWGSSAYMAADQIAAHTNFFEVSVSDLRTLPAGAVVVWGRGSSAHGHISIALGDGREASDHIAQQMTYHYGGGRARVFYPL